MLDVPDLAFLQLYMAFLQLCRFFWLFYNFADSCCAGFGFSTILQILAVHRIWLFYNFTWLFYNFCRFFGFSTILLIFAVLDAGFGFSTILQILAFCAHAPPSDLAFLQLYIDACCTGFGFSTTLHGFSTTLQILWLFYNFADSCCMPDLAFLQFC